MSFGDSEAVFTQRAREIGLDEAAVKCLTDEGISTMALFAFSCNFSPGASDEKPFTDLIRKLLRRDPSTLELSCMRRLFNESYANVASDIKARTEATDDTPIRRLAPAERASRLKDQQQRLSGLSISGQYEPGDTLIDRCISIYDSDRLQYVEWAVSVSREHELLTGTKRDSSISFDSSGALKLSKQQKVDPCSTGSEIQVRHCLVRRALAFDQSNLIEFKLMEAWTEKLLQARLEEPSPGFARTTMRQLELADRKLFCVLAEKTRDGIKSTTKGRPLDAVFKESTECSEVQSLLQPRPLSVAADKNKETGPSGGEPPTKKPRREAPVKGKGKGGKTSAFVRIPHELLKLNCVAATPKNNRICSSNDDAIDVTTSEGEPEVTMHDATTKCTDNFLENFQHVKASAHVSGKQTPYVFLELCAGSASLSAEVKKLGVEVLAFDHESNRHETKCKVISLDLSLPHAFTRLTDLVNSCNVLGAHLGPPCGTCSKARGIPMADGSAGPQPLRDSTHLLGLPHLQHRDLQRVTAANALYEQLGKFVELLESKGIPWTIENPTNSFLWDLPYFSFAMAHGIKYDCHACAFGSSRKKLTSFLSNRHEFIGMCKFCDDVAPHEHEGWGYDHVNKVFNTAKEAEYPHAMCKQYAQILAQMMDVTLIPTAQPRMSPQLQPRGRKVPQIIPEFLEVASRLLPEIPALDNKHTLLQPCGPIPAGSKLLRSEADKGSLRTLSMRAVQERSTVVMLVQEIEAIGYQALAQHAIEFLEALKTNLNEARDKRITPKSKPFKGEQEGKESTGAEESKESKESKKQHGRARRGVERKQEETKKSKARNKESKESRDSIVSSPSACAYHSFAIFLKLT
eukprot:s946_g19.t1